MKQPAQSPRGKPAAKAKRKSREDLNLEARDRKRDKKHRGHAAGSRANPEKQAAGKSQARDSQDPRLGSKKPIALVAEGQTSVVKKTTPKPKVEKVRLTLQEELAKLENDERLDTLLDRLESGETLSGEEQAWLDETLDRIDELMETLGIALDDDADDDEQAEEDMMRLLKGK